MSEFSQSDLSNLWIQAGGPSAVAPLMAAIAMAESSGNPNASNPQTGACGLWQINPAQDGCTDPFTNAQQAVSKYNSQGLNAWTSYSNGSYKQFYSGTTTLDSSSSSDNGCHTLSILNMCFDGVVGLGAIALGVGLAVIAVTVLIIKSPVGQSAVKAAKTAAVLVPK